MAHQQGARQIADPEADAPPIRVAIANDTELVAEGLAALLRRYPHRVEVVAASLRGEPWRAAEVGGQRPDVLLVDAFGRDGLGADHLRQSREAAPELAVVVFTEAGDLHHLFEALRLGVRGYLLKSTGAAELVDAIESVVQGETVIDPRLAVEAAMVAARLADGFDWPGAHLGLSRREGEVLQEIAGGGGLDEVAGALGVGRETVRTHLRNVYRKLGVHRRADAAAIAWREGIAR